VIGVREEWVRGRRVCERFLHGNHLLVPAAVLGGGLGESRDDVERCFLGGEGMLGPSRSLDSMVRNIRFMSITCMLLVSMMAVMVVV
jgi:hypothetical protein